MAQMVHAVILGMREFRSQVTSATEFPAHYDWGRELMHRVTFRYFEVER